ncbi:MAG: DegT/DnrJ/EryC1/StrS family aminotransferase [Candidatus Hydrogenedentota bacterium]
MKIAFVDLKRQYKRYKKEIDRAIKNVIRDSAFVGGHYLECFEKNFADYIGRKFCVGVGNGTDAIFLTLLSLGIGKGDEVIVPSHTFVATVEAVSATGAEPVFVDIYEDHYTMSVEKIKTQITDRTKAIIPVHLYGQPCDMDQICIIAKENNIHIIEDCAQAHGALYKGRKTGTFGVAGCFSFFPGKNLGAYGDAGCVVCDDEALFKKIKAIKDHGRSDKYTSLYIGYNSRLDGLQAAILDVKLKYIDRWNDKRRKIAQWYSKLLQNTDVILPVEFKDVKHIYHLYVIRIKKNREKFMSFLKEAGISCGIHYPIPCHMFQPYKNKRGADSLPVTEKITKEIASLPIFPELTQKEVIYITNKIKEYLKRN